LFYLSVKRRVEKFENLKIRKKLDLLQECHKCQITKVFHLDLARCPDLFAWLRRGKGGAAAFSSPLLK
jgi:hypothetical protein